MSETEPPSVNCIDEVGHNFVERIAIREFEIMICVGLLTTQRIQFSLVIKSRATGGIK